MGTSGIVFFGRGAALCCEGLSYPVQDTENPWHLGTNRQECSLFTVTTQISFPRLPIAKY